MHSAIHQSSEGIVVNIVVTPGAKHEGVESSKSGNFLKVKVKSPATKGKANREVLALFSKLFGSCYLSSGFHSRKKTITIPGKSRDEVYTKLNDHLKTKNI